MLDLETIGRLAWLIPAFTATAFVVALAVTVAGARSRWSAIAAVTGICLSSVLALLLLAATWRTGSESLAHQPFVWSVPWLPMGERFLTLGVLVDPLSASVAVMVALICAAIFVYSTAYMEGEHTAYRDPVGGAVDLGVGNARYARFFAFVSLFATGMLGFVLAANLVQALVFWEIMGLCSFLLIGFWYHRPAASAAAVKAFLTTRIGDVFLLSGILVLYGVFGSVDYATILSAEGVDRLRALGTVPGTGMAWSSVLALLIFAGAVGKSAQFPLHVWLPDAMEGPTPVSALIHAATMVSAGVFLVARMHPLFSAASTDPSAPGGAMPVVALIGCFTALFAATIAVTQFDIKRVLAYSTISQLGYMFLALGMGAYVAATFHLITHAFFKALLFLGSGSVIHGVDHGAHLAHDLDRLRQVGSGRELPDLPAPSPDADPRDPQDMRNMGNLRERMPFTFLAFLAGALALTGIIPFAGFWSKDEILGEAFHRGITMQEPWLALLWLGATATALLTAFYMARQVFMVFYGPPHSAGARHASESDIRMVGPLVFLAIFATFLGLFGVHESFPVIGSALGNPFHHFLGVLTATGQHFPAVPFDVIPVLVSLGAALGGWVLGWFVYGRDPAAARALDPLRPRLGRAWQVAHDKYYVDELYGATFIRLTIAASSACALVDRVVVDGAVNGCGRLGQALSAASQWVDTIIVDGLVNLVGAAALGASRQARRLQTGWVQQYLLVVFVSVLCLIVAFVL